MFLPSATPGRKDRARGRPQRQQAPGPTRAGDAGTPELRLQISTVRSASSGLEDAGAGLVDGLGGGLVLLLSAEPAHLAAQRRRQRRLGLLGPGDARVEVAPWLQRRPEPLAPKCFRGRDIVFWSQLLAARLLLVLGCLVDGQQTRWGALVAMRRRWAAWLQIGSERSAFWGPAPEVAFLVTACRSRPLAEWQGAGGGRTREPTWMRLDATAHADVETHTRKLA